ncbi:MAG: substrate-binding domain-containing protein [Nitrospiraceae bacterium]
MFEFKAQKPCCPSCSASRRIPETPTAEAGIDVTGGGSAKAIEQLVQPPLKSTSKIHLKEERHTPALVVASSRPLTQSEIAQFTAQHGHAPLTVAVAVDAVALYVHKDNPIEGLTLKQVDAIFSSTHNRRATRHQAMGSTRARQQVEPFSDPPIRPR